MMEPRATGEPVPAASAPPSTSEVAAGKSDRVEELRRGVKQTEIVRTHGLPEADGCLNKGGIFRALLSLLRPGRLLDLPAGKGNFSLMAVELGWQATAVDVRTVRYPDAETADPDSADLIRAIRWVQADVREAGETREERDQVPTASWGNALSFRHTEASLLRLLRDCGYDQVMVSRPPHRKDYTFYFCLPRTKVRKAARMRKQGRGHAP